MSTTGISDLRSKLGIHLNAAEYAGERITITRNGRPVAAIISIDDLRLLEALEDRVDIAAADEAVRESDADGWLSWEEVVGEPTP